MAKPKGFAVLWSATAAADLRSIIEYLAEEAPDAAAQALARIEAQAALLRSLPLRGRIVPELAAQEINMYRELVVRPWRIVYRVEGAEVWVLAVLDSRRNLEDLLLDRFLR